MRHRYGMIHGRFQPFHRGHFAYALAALARCDHLIIGITNPDPSTIVTEAADPERHRPEANVFTYFERQRMIRAAFDRAGVEPRRISIVPLPIHHPDRWTHYAPAGSVQFLRIFSDWGRTKADRFRAAGWDVEILDPDMPKEVSGQTVRDRLIADEGWAGLVPAGVEDVLREIGAIDRVQGVARAGPAASEGA